MRAWETGEDKSVLISVTGSQNQMLPKNSGNSFFGTYEWIIATNGPGLYYGVKSNQKM